METNRMIESWRVQAGLKQKEVAEKLYLTPQAYSLLEKGKRPLSLERMQKIADICGKDLRLIVEDRTVFEPLSLENQHRLTTDEESAIISIDHLDAREIIKNPLLNEKFYFLETSGYRIEESLQKLKTYFGTPRPFNMSKPFIFVVQGTSEFHFEHLDTVSKYIYEEVLGAWKDKIVMIGAEQHSSFTQFKIKLGWSELPSVS